MNIVRTSCQAKVTPSLLIIWPAATRRSSWTTHPTPDWHFAHSKSGYTDSVISLYWIQHVFDPHTKALAGDKPRLLISDGFGTHESLEIMKFCLLNRIVLCRLPSPTSHKLQPCDVGVFSSLKTAYREHTESLERGGANIIGKQHFTYLYSRARDQAFNYRNILSGWSKTGLRPFNPERFLRDIQKPLAEDVPTSDTLLAVANDLPDTPVSPRKLALLRSEVEMDAHQMNEGCRLRLQKILNATERAFAERSLLLQQNHDLYEQNNEKKSRQRTKSTVAGKAKVMTFEDIAVAKRKREEKEAAREAKRRNKWAEASEMSHALPHAEGKRCHVPLRGIEHYCSVLQFD